LKRPGGKRELRVVTALDRLGAEDVGDVDDQDETTLTRVLKVIEENPGLRSERCLICPIRR
jgi:hypothetical protein